jgi:hypothetical protein
MSATRLKIFISCVQKEFQQIRLDLKAFLLGDAVLHRFISEVFLFEDLPATDRRADQVYLEEVERCDIYLGIFGYEYGNEDHDGVSPTEHEYDHATKKRKTRLVYVWGSDEKRRAPKMRKLVGKVSGEAIVNAIAHRDYHSNASVEVRLFADRLEVWNPGRLPGTLTLDDLRDDHPSVPYNPLVAESLYLTRYIERVGSGTQTMIELCREAGLPEPQFEQRSGSFVITLWRDWLTDKVVAELHLNDRQVQAVMHAKTSGRISTGEYRAMTKTSESTALRELRHLTKLCVLEKVGGSGRAAHYVVAKGKPVINPSNPSEIDD